MGEFVNQPNSPQIQYERRILSEPNPILMVENLYIINLERL